MKKLFLGMLVAIVAVGGSVGTYASSLHSNGKLAPVWYSFTGDDPEDPNDYTRKESEPSGCTGGTNVCAILAEPDAGDTTHPNLNIVSQTTYKLNP